MATQRGSCLATLLLVVLVFTGETNGEQLVVGISEGPSPAPAPAPEFSGRRGIASVGEAPNPGPCTEYKLYTGLCVETACVAACLLSFKQGGHCGDGSMIHRDCLCFSCGPRSSSSSSMQI